MAEGENKDLLARIADAGEGVINRFGEMPGLGKITEPLLALRQRVDDLQRRVRGLDQLEHRMTDVERRLDVLETKPSTRGRKAKTALPEAAETPPAAKRGAALEDDQGTVDKLD
ncbi:MAG: hypothetical protein H0U03_06455 [Actinobacteria bacterium]|nr:hypothetical protein [Actinomycetota bacterium]